MSTTLYALLGGIYYEGVELLGVYSTRERAEEASKAPSFRGYDSYDVEEVTVDEVRKL